MLSLTGFSNQEYMKFVVNKPPTLKEFVINLKEKQTSSLFLGDMEGLLSPDVKYDQDKAFEWFEKNIVPLIG
jgi:hypothetical protein